MLEYYGELFVMIIIMIGCMFFGAALLINYMVEHGYDVKDIAEIIYDDEEIRLKD